MVIIGVAVVLQDVPAAYGTCAQGETEVEGPDREVNDVGSHARGPAAAEVHPRTMIIGVRGQGLIIRTQGRRTDPHLPIEALDGTAGRALSDALGMLVHDVKGPHHAHWTKVAGENRSAARR